MATYPKAPEQWREALNALPPASTTGRIPAFFFGHGQPMLIWPESAPQAGRSGLDYSQLGPNGPLANFLKDFGPVLVEKYKPKAILVFSAHWETSGERLVTDYGDENPLLMDYYGFHPDLYKVQFKSKGDAALSQQVVDLLKKHGIPARKTTKSEPRGRDGRGFNGPGLDHGVFVPFKLMFGNSTDIPIVQVSIDESLSPEANWELGKAVRDLRSQGVLVLSGGLPIHTFEDRSAFSEKTAKPVYLSFDKAVVDAAGITDAKARREALLGLTAHPGFRLSNPREEHFIPIYVAAGCGEEGEAKVVSAVYGAPTIAFGI